MNYQKKRKRQNGRQKRNGTSNYKIWLDDEFDKLHATIDKAIKDGHLPPVSFDPIPVVRCP